MANIWRYVHTLVSHKTFGNKNTFIRLTYTDNIMTNIINIVNKIITIYGFTFGLVIIKSVLKKK